jgi:uncharacterized protein YcbX
LHPFFFVLTTDAMLDQLSLPGPISRTFGIALFASLFVGLILFRRRRPTVHARARVAKLIIYPIKSVPGIEVDHLEVHDSVLKYKNIYDRHWMIVDDAGHTLRLLDAPDFARIKVTYENEGICLRAPNLPDLHIKPIEQIEKDQLVYSTSLLGQPIHGLYAGDEPSEWFAKLLQRPGVRMLQFHRKLKQLREGEYVVDRKMTQSSKNPIRYQDCAPCLLLNEASRFDLIDRLKKKAAEQGSSHVEDVTYDRFRPNVLADGFKPYEEDNWSYVQIGRCMFEVRVACGRCRMITLDTKSIEFSEEPLRTLREYRMGTPGINGPNTPVMGTYIQNIGTGVIRLEDIVYTDK